MGYNIYYNPESFGLSILDLIDGGGSYEFDMVVVWANSKGQLFYDTDSGCSCPTPFENSSIQTLTPITKQTLKDFELAVRSVSDREYGESNPAEGSALIQKVKTYLRNRKAVQV